MFKIKEKHIILFLGRINKVKGIEFLLEGFNELCHERNDVVLAIVGPDEGYKPILEQLINNFDIGNKVIFTGTLTGDKKIAVLNEAEMLVQTSIHERGPGSPFEAVLCGTPIIVTRHTGAGDIVAKINAGLLVDYGDVKGLKNLMVEIIKEPQKALETT
jgi:glycosyltransferase involved in cell wall biosynthesis